MEHKNKYKTYIESCLQCAAACNHCASSCTRGKHFHEMAKCIQWDMECAAFCYASAQLMSMDSSKAKAICGICAEICESCCAECSKHDMDHCQECAAACKKCAAECKKMAA